MRSLEFRGKMDLRFKGKVKWLYGSYVTDAFGEARIATKDVSGQGLNFYYVELESVGQAIELNNKVKKVFEGDIVKAFKPNSGIDWKDDLYLVEYDINFSQFVLRCISSKNKNRVGKIAMKANNQPYLLKNITEIVGNKIDNKDLVKQWE